MSPPPPPDLSGDYERWTRYPVIFVPVVLAGKQIGSLYASPGRNVAGYKHKLSAEADKLACYGFWDSRLAESYRAGLPPEQAIRNWIGVPEDPRCGGVPAGTHESEARTVQELWDDLNPEGPALGEGPWVQDNEFPDGTPADRSKGWASAVSVKRPRYERDTASAVRYYPVVLEGVRIGFLWASPTEPAAGYLPLAAAGKRAEQAAGLWNSRLSDGCAAGRTALATVRECRKYSENIFGGKVDSQASEYEASSMSDLERLAGERAE